MNKLIQAGEQVNRYFIMMAQSALASNFINLSWVDITGWASVLEMISQFRLSYVGAVLANNGLTRNI